MDAHIAIVNGVSNKYDGISNERGYAMKSDDKWVNLAKGIIRAEMTRRSITYDQLAERLSAMGIEFTAVNLRNKVARGGFSAVFFLQCLSAIGCTQLHLGDA